MSSASFSRCCACDHTTPVAASPTPITATASSTAIYVNPAWRRSPLAIGLAVRAVATGAALHVVDAALLALGGGYHDPGTVALRQGIARDRADVALGDELLERGGIQAGVGVMLVDRLAHHQEIFPQHRLFGAVDPARIARRHDR